MPFGGRFFSSGEAFGLGGVERAILANAARTRGEES